MNRSEYLLTVLAEECSEVAQAASKILRFGLKNHFPGKHILNDEHLVQEFYDMMAVLEMLQEDGILPTWVISSQNFQKEAKKKKVEKYMKKYKNDL